MYWGFDLKEEGLKFGFGITFGAICGTTKNGVVVGVVIAGVGIAIGSVLVAKDDFGAASDTSSIFIVGIAIVVVDVVVVLNVDGEYEVVVGVVEDEKEGVDVRPETKEVLTIAKRGPEGKREA